MVEKYKWLFIWVIAISSSFSVYDLAHEELKNQQRQINQLSDAIFEVAKEHGARDQFGLTGGKKYCLIFADFNINRALIGEFDEEICYDKEPRLIIMHNIDERTLEYWNKQHIIFGRYKEIPR